VRLELRLWVATCVTGLATFCASALGVHPAQGGSLEALLVVFFSTLALYNLDGTLDAPARELPRSARRAHMTLTALSLLALGVLTSTLAPSAFALTAAGLGACGLYAVPLTKRNRTLRLKALPYLKAPFVGVAVAVAVVWVPLLGQVDADVWPGAVGLTVVLSFFCTANAVLFDIPDRDEDLRQQTPTVAAEHGVDEAKRLSAGLCGLGLALSVLLAALSHTLAQASPGLAPGTLLGLVALGAYLIAISSRIDGRTRASTIAWLVDGGLLLPLLFLSWLA
jgi:4-hydroxybenzoate polyprenyltransferase